METSAGLIFVTLVFSLSGALAVLASLFNWNWFFESGNAKLLTGKFRRRTARIVYFVAGILILAMVAAIYLRVSAEMM